MRRAKDIGKIKNCLQSHVTRLQASLSHARSAKSVRDTEIYVGHCVLNLLNQWNNFCRAYYLSCMLEARLESGTKVQVNQPGLTHDAALGAAITLFKPSAVPNTLGAWNKRDEPKWYEKDKMLQISKSLFSATHDSLVQAAYSLNSRVFIDLPVSRNYFAHKNQQTSRSASGLASFYGIPATRRPSQVLLSRPLGGIQDLINDWISDLLLVAEFLCG